MLATYPEVFAGGAVIGGLPYRSANTLMQAMVRMKGYGGPSDRQLGALVRDATAHDAQWPTISVWHGDSDTTVDPSNAEAIVRQWQVLHGVEGPPTFTEEVDGHPRRVWRSSAGREVIEAFRIAGRDTEPARCDGAGTVECAETICSRWGFRRHVTLPASGA